MNSSENILDSFELIKSIDKSGMLSVVEKFPTQCKEAAKIGDSIKISWDCSSLRSVIVLGMGGSGIGGDILKTVLADELNLPVFVNKTYQLPAFVNNESLVFAVSYSGNTEETLSGFDEARARKARIVAVTSGGELKEKAEKLNYPIVKIPAGFQPRAVLGYLFFPVIIALAKIGLIKDKSDDIHQTIELLDELSKNYSSSNPLDKNKAKQLAVDLFNQIPVIYGSDGLTDVSALRWKCQFNENSKIPAFNHIFPELNHNEIVGWERLKELNEKFSLIFLRDESDHSRLIKRMDVTKELLADSVGNIYEVWTKGKSKLTKIFSSIYLGDFISVYLALLYKVDPTPVERITLLKNRLSET
ncbi:MAG: bifunctional phosphoglucose/phosphomannose isomerase [Actinobacteria bacterium]|nr:bifunctional phosphoglucose/phosphomannose isomerase [Actinomycetota bacterium]